MSETQRMDQVYFGTSTAELAPSDTLAGKTEARGWLSGFDLPRPSGQWTTTMYAALAVLFAIWCFQLYSTWATWGNVTIDSGHEMYIPVVLAQGKMLYRDVWFMYTPLAPYFNSYLFRIFGIHLNVLYLAGALAALGSAIFLFFAGISLSSWMAGWAAGAVILLEAFRPSLFSFPLPYSFSPVYGCLVACLFTWLTIKACLSSNWWWMFAAGMAAATALLLKPEYGTAAYGTLAILVLTRALDGKSWKSVATDSLAVLPGGLLCVAVILWMVSIRGVDFIIHENIVSWPTAYFMKAYGKLWLQRTGFELSFAAFRSAFMASIPVAAVAIVSSILLRWKRSGVAAIVTKAGMVLALIPICLLFVERFPSSSHLHRLRQIVSAIFFPQAMVLYIAIASLIAWGIYGWHYLHGRRSMEAAVPLILTFSSLLAFRILLRMSTEGYPIYYNGPVVFGFLLLACAIVPRNGYSPSIRSVLQGLICLACLSAVPSREARDFARKLVPLTTDRGTMRVPKNMAANYKIAAQFMRDKAAQGESVLPVPEDTSLFFFSGTTSPTRVFSFTPGVLAPGKMTNEMLDEIEKNHVRYLIWSNDRVFTEFGTPIFGVDFDRDVGDYFKSHYRPIGRLVPGDTSTSDWNPTIWERRAGE